MPRPCATAAWTRPARTAPDASSADTTERQELTIPPSVEAEQAKGFALYAIRTVLDGKGTELIDLTKANIRQLF